MIIELIGFGFFCLACHFVLLEVFKKKLKEDFPVEYKELGNPPFNDFFKEGTQKNFYKGDTPRLAKFLRNREFIRMESTSLTLMGYFILVSKVLVYITLISLIIMFFVP